MASVANLLGSFDVTVFVSVDLGRWLEAPQYLPPTLIHTYPWVVPRGRGNRHVEFFNCNGKAALSVYWCKGASLVHCCVLEISCTFGQVSQECSQTCSWRAHSSGPF